MAAPWPAFRATLKVSAGNRTVAFHRVYKVCERFVALVFYATCSRDPDVWLVGF